MKNKDDYDENFMTEFDAFVNSFELDKNGYTISYCRDTTLRRETVAWRKFCDVKKLQNFKGKLSQMISNNKLTFANVYFKR